MRLYSSIFRYSLLFLALVPLLGAPRAAAQATADHSTAFPQTSPVPARITQAIDETQLVRLRGNVHPMARREFDQGPVPDSQPLNRMLLVLQRSPEQEAALQKLMEEQQTKDSPNYHAWLTPEQFGKQFGPADEDIQTVKDWLTSHGFQGIKVGTGRTVIEFSGTAGLVQNAFHTEIHHLMIDGEAHMANMSDPQIPAALVPVIAGVASLHNFRKRSFAHFSEVMTRAKQNPAPGFSTGTGTFAVGPADFAKIYNIPVGLDGTGQSIAIVGRTNINLSDIHDFRTGFGLPMNDPQIILNGPDPGVLSPALFPGEETEALLDTEWSGAVAPMAKILFVVSETPQSVLADGADLSALYIVDSNLAPVMSVSFGSCEAALGTTGNQLQNALWQQAAAQGITVMVASGDSGAAGCDPAPPPANQDAASLGIAVSGTASTPFNVAVGGTDFDYSATPESKFWSTTNSGTGKESALSYIPEMTWNSSCARTATSGNVASLCTNPNSQLGVDVLAGSGGPSGSNAGGFAGYPKPSWQSGAGVPADGKRDIPDVSLFAAVLSISNNFYVMCQADSPLQKGQTCNLTGPSFSFTGVGGTSASSPTFAAIIALINQKTGQRQGNANYVLYNLARQAGATCNSSTVNVTSNTCVFYDVTKGNISVACVGGSPDCSNKMTGQFGVLATAAGGTTPAWVTTAGYDQATGLGSVNVTNLANAWLSAQSSLMPSTTSLALNPAAAQINITHGESVNLTATVNHAMGGSGTPTGVVSLVTDVNPDALNLPGTTATTNLGVASFPLNTSGVGSGSTNLLPGGTYNLKAHYPGDGTFAASESNLIPVTVAKENSVTSVGLVTFSPTTGAVTSLNAKTAAYGSPYILRVDVTNSSGQQCSVTAVPCPTGSVSLTDNGSSLDFGTSNLNSAGFLEDQPIQLTGGSHSIVATYAGDSSYNPSSNTASPDIVSITPAATTTTLSSGASTVQVNQGITLTVAIASQSNSTVGPTGNATFKDGSTTIGTATATPAGATPTAGASATAVLNTSFATTGSHMLTAVYAGDTNYATSTSAAVPLTVGVATTTTVSASPTSLPAGGGSVMLTATVTGSGSGASPTGTVQFKNGSAALGAAAMCTAVSGAMTPTCKATLTTNLAFFAPPSAPPRIPGIRFQPVVPIALLFLLLFFLGLKRIPVSYRRAYACLSLLLLVGLVAGLMGCGGGYGGGGGGGGVHYDSITTVYSGDGTYAGSTSQAVTITVQ